jgi:hypothetical protein
MKTTSLIPVAIAAFGLVLPRVLPDNVASGGPVARPTCTSKTATLDCVPTNSILTCNDGLTVEAVDDVIAQARYIPADRNCKELVGNQAHCNGRAAAALDDCEPPTAPPGN